MEAIKCSNCGSEKVQELTEEKYFCHACENIFLVHNLSKEFRQTDAHISEVHEDLKKTIQREVAYANSAEANVDELFARAEQLMKLEQYKEAESCYTRISELKPLDGKARVGFFCASTDNFTYDGYFTEFGLENFPEEYGYLEKCEDVSSDEKQKVNDYFADWMKRQIELSLEYVNGLVNMYKYDIYNEQQDMAESIAQGNESIAQCIAQGNSEIKTLQNKNLVMWIVTGLVDFGLICKAIGLFRDGGIKNIFFAVLLIALVIGVFLAVVEFPFSDNKRKQGVIKRKMEDDKNIIEREMEDNRGNSENFIAWRMQRLEHLEREYIPDLRNRLNNLVPNIRENGLAKNVDEFMTLAENIMDHGAWTLDIDCEFLSDDIGERLVDWYFENSGCDTREEAYAEFCECKQASKPLFLPYDTREEAEIDQKEVDEIVGNHTSIKAFFYDTDLIQSIFGKYAEIESMQGQNSPIAENVSEQDTPSNAVKYCPMCGQQNESGALFCGACGYKVQ